VSIYFFVAEKFVPAGTKIAVNQFHDVKYGQEVLETIRGNLISCFEIPVKEEGGCGGRKLANHCGQPGCHHISRTANLLRDNHFQAEAFAEGLF
jgi:hypothetical protein